MPEKVLDMAALPCYDRDKKRTDGEVKEMILTKADLLAIGQVMDEKLKPIEERLDRVEDRLDRLEKRVDGLEQRVGGLEQRVGGLEQGFVLLKEEVADLGKRVDRLEQGFVLLKEEVAGLGKRVDGLEAEVRGIKVYLESNIEPRLKTIESAYLSTYNRYCRETERMQKTYSDVELLKGAVVEHSRTLSRHEQLIAALQAV